MTTPTWIARAGGAYFGMKQEKQGGGGGGASARVAAAVSSNIGSSASSVAALSQIQAQAALPQLLGQFAGILDSMYALAAKVKQSAGGLGIWGVGGYLGG